MPTRRGYAALRQHRALIPNTRYFLTLCTASRQPVLVGSEIAGCITSELEAIQGAGHWRLMAHVIMPDHVHILAKVGESLSLSRVVARLKFKTKDVVRRAGAEWQGNYYEHRLRPTDAEEDVLRYVFLNPHRAGLLEPDAKWPWFQLGADEAQWFIPTLNEGRPFPEWLK